MAHRLDLAREAPWPQASQSSSFPGWRLHTATSVNSPPGPRGRREPHSQEGLTRGYRRHCTQPTGSFWGGTRSKKGRAQVKLFCPRRPVSRGVLGGAGRLMRAIMHAHPSSPPSSITTAIVKAATPRRVASDVPTQGFPSKGRVTSTLLLASPKSPALLHRAGRPGFSSFPGRGSPSFGEGGHQAGTALAPFNPTPNILTPF